MTVAWLQIFAFPLLPTGELVVDYWDSEEPCCSDLSPWGEWSGTAWKQPTITTHRPDRIQVMGFSLYFFGGWFFWVLGLEKLKTSIFSMCFFCGVQRKCRYYDIDNLISWWCLVGYLVTFPWNLLVRTPSLPETAVFVAPHRDVISFEPMVQFSGARC